MSILERRVAIVTGASKGIGRVICQVFASHGARVVCAARSRALVDETAAAIRQSGGEAIPVCGDVADEADVRRLIATTLDTFGRLDCLINNAGDGGPTRPLSEYSADDWFGTLNSCLTSAYLCSRFAAGPMAEGGGGTMVNISSMAARRGLPFRVGYCAAKAGQLGLTRALAQELGPDGIRVNAILPAAVAGDRIDRVIDAQARVRGIDEATMRRSLIDRSPLRRMVEAGDIAALAAFLCSDAALNISGQCIPVTAGEPA